MNIEIIEANLGISDHQTAIVMLLDEYAKDLQGYNRKLPDEVLKNVVPEMKKIPTTLVFLAAVNNEFVGMAICFIGFSTFYAKPVINIHDFTVLKNYRRQRIGSELVKAIEQKAERMNCCKLTLEVQEMNKNGINLYEKCGFEKAILDESEGNALFFSKYLKEKKL